MRKNISFIVILVVMLNLLVGTAVHGQEPHKDMRIILNGSRLQFDQPPTIINDRTLIPVRALFEALGMTVDWDEDSRTVTASASETTIELQINSDTMVKNGERILIDAAACIINGRTLIPVRAACEAVGAAVKYDDFTKNVIIGTGGFDISSFPRFDMTPASYFGKTPKQMVELLGEISYNEERRFYTFEAMGDDVFFEFDAPPEFIIHEGAVTDTPAECISIHGKISRFISGDKDSYTYEELDMYFGELGRYMGHNGYYPCKQFENYRVYFDMNNDICWFYTGGPTEAYEESTPIVYPRADTVCYQEMPWAPDFGYYTGLELVGFNDSDKSGLYFRYDTPMLEPWHSAPYIRLLHDLGYKQIFGEEYTGLFRGGNREIFIHFASHITIVNVTEHK